MAEPQSGTASPSGEPAYVEPIVKYYDGTWFDYRVVWMRGLGMHWGYWDDQTRNHAQSLTNMTRALAEQIIHRRKNKPMFFIDIAVPRDIDPAVNEIDNAFLYDIDDLQQVIDSNLKGRMKEASRAEEIVDHEVQAFCTKMQSREVVPMIVQLRDTLEKLRRDEIERNRRHLKDLSPEQQAAIDQLTRSLVNKILHPPIEQLKQIAHDPQGPDIVDLIRKLFNVKPQ